MADRPPDTSWRDSLVHRRSGDEIEFTRVVAFSDGVMAIAITLLVLTLEVPGVPAAELTDALAANWREYMAFAISFALIGRFWILHHRTFSLMARTDGTVMTLNLGFLGLVVLVPFTTDLVADFDESALAVGLYGATIGLTAVLHWLMIHHAVRAGHVRTDRDAAARLAASPRSLGPGLIFLASIPVALLSPVAAMLMWLATFAPGLRPRMGSGAPPDQGAGAGG
jgi:uncharacterized membrane protein